MLEIGDHARVPLREHGEERVVRGARHHQRHLHHLALEDLGVANGLLQRGVGALEGLEIGGVASRGGELGHLRVERGADLEPAGEDVEVDVAVAKEHRAHHVGAGRRERIERDGAQAARGLHEPVHLEQLDGLAHDAARAPVARGELVFLRQQLTDGDSPVDNLLEQIARDGVGLANGGLHAGAYTSDLFRCNRLRARGRGGDGDGERRPGPGGALDGDVPAVSVRDRSRNRQSESCAHVAGIIPLPVPVEDVRDLIDRDAGSRVRDREDDALGVARGRVAPRGHPAG